MWIRAIVALRTGLQPTGIHIRMDGVSHQASKCAARKLHDIPGI